MKTEERNRLANETVAYMQAHYERNNEQGDFDAALWYMQHEADEFYLRSEHARWRAIAARDSALDSSAKKPA